MSLPPGRPLVGLARVSGILAAALTIGAAGRAFAFTPSGQKWSNDPNTPVPYMLDPSGTKDVTDGSALAAIRNAFATWQAAPCSYLKFGETAWTESAVAAKDGANRVFFVQAPGGWTQPADELALTYVYYDTSTNLITDADVTVNNVNFAFTTDSSQVGTGSPQRADVATVVLHEIGHFLGLNHSNDPGAVMYASANKSVARTLAVDDIDGVCAIYSNGTAAPLPAPGMGSVGAVCATAGDCASGVCGVDQGTGAKYCTQTCTVGQVGGCPGGFQCEMSSTGATAYCVAASVDDTCDPCNVNGECSSGFCTAVSGYNNGHAFCSRPCDPTPGQPSQCPANYQCVAVQAAAGGACAPTSGICQVTNRGGQGQPCFPTGTCNTGFTCIPYYPGMGPNFCYFACNPSYVGVTCGPTNTLCQPVSGQMSSAACFTISTAGQHCIPEVCDSTSFCAYDPQRGVTSAQCYRQCPNGQGDCPTNEQCQGAMGLPNLCVPLQGFKADGESCTADSECVHRTCRTYGADRLCTTLCTATSSAGCAAGFRCLTAQGSNDGLCWPTMLGGSAGQGPVQQSCTCDVTSRCDANCGCDSDCKHGCGCSTAGAMTAALDWVSSALFTALGSAVLGRLLWAVRRRRRALPPAATAERDA